MTSTLNLNGASIMITGANGFIGGRLVEYLVLHYGANVRALTHHFGRAVRIARLPIKLIPGDVLDPASIREAMTGCTVVFHLAYGSVGDNDLRMRVTVDGTRNVIDAALAANVDRFVYTSTIAVHGPDPGPVVDESTPYQYNDDPYIDGKIDAEKLIFEAIRNKGLPAVILRPTTVYGPYSSGWTLAQVERLKEGTLTLYDQGRGIVNHVYVDDVVQALLLAAIKPQAMGEAFVVSSGFLETWKEFFGYYAAMVGVKELPSISLEEIAEQRRKLQLLRNPINMGLSFVASPHAQSIARQLPGVGGLADLLSKGMPAAWQQRLMDRARMLRELKLHPPVLPRQWSVDFYCARSACKIEKAQQLLGYQPVFSLEAGMRLTEDWLRYQRVI